ncbi:MAG TPA: hypothetical protein VGG11_00465 [Xanthobacteraceae bacterium]|jgi:hypothetical protein
MAEEGELNGNDQRLLRKTAFAGNDHNQRIWAVQCERAGCGHVYGVNGSDFHERRCPKCDNGKPGL